MAALIVEEGRAAREKSQRLRSDSTSARLAAMANAHTADERTTRMAAAAGTRRQVAAPAYSAWSSLTWRYDDGALNSVLVPLA